MFASDLIRDMYSPMPTQDLESALAFPPNGTASIKIVLLNNEQRQLEVPNNWTSEQLLADVIGSPAEAREYYLRCPEAGLSLSRDDTMGNFDGKTCFVSPKVCSACRGDTMSLIVVCFDSFSSPSTWCANRTRHCLDSRSSPSWPPTWIFGFLS